MKQDQLNKYIKPDSRLEIYAWNVVKDLRTFTADDLHALESEIREHNRDKRVIGSLLKGLEQKGKIRKLGYVASTRVKCHCRPILQWEVVK